jgi:hypothetical protein
MPSEGVSMTFARFIMVGLLLASPAVASDQSASKPTLYHCMFEDVRRRSAGASE